MYPRSFCNTRENAKRAMMIAEMETIRHMFNFALQCRMLWAKRVWRNERIRVGDERKISNRQPKRETCKETGCVMATKPFIFDSSPPTCLNGQGYLFPIVGVQVNSPHRGIRRGINDIISESYTSPLPNPCTNVSPRGRGDVVAPPSRA